MSTDKTSLQADREDWGMGGGKRKSKKGKEKEGEGKERKGREKNGKERERKGKERKGKRKERSGLIWPGLVLVCSWSGLVWSLSAKIY